MNFSTAYLLYPPNRALERSIADSLGLLSAELAAAAAPDTQVAMADNFRFTRGNYEQHRYSARIFEPLREALEAALNDDAAKISRDREPQDWAAKQNDLGNILAALGQQRRDVASLERAIQCFGKALEVFTRESAPQQWAATQYNLATANQTLGRQSEATAPLKTAVDAYTEALQVWTREQSPQDWMLTLHQLGATLYTFGKQLKGNRQFQKSVVAYKNALATLNADDYALELVATHNNRGVTLHNLGESEENAARLKEAINSYELALTVSMEQQLPIHVAVLCRVNKATVQNSLAQLSNDAVLAEEVADEFEVIMECFPHALQPLCLKHCEEQMKLARSQQRVINS
ncbi:MAG: tetratricopeptide repeat protein [Gammaproteobacteria bacterium]|nr:tetratricopeptide repeat protein [Gammaproteobacteria bacterium]MBU1775100.1 tetratricopeptide repeat protein [Gammaproteobacteria bacterium]MBU1969897.1 tetratricopeptide repeat protein [Gammaproteobacteria bacterium]